MLSKRGVSDVVATVLIIALTILAISILWVGVIPLVKNNLGVNDICSSVDISISTSQGYTCYQPNEITSVQINKGAKESNISGLKFYLLSNGNSIQYSKDIALGKNTFTSFFLNSSAISKVEKLQVVPVVKNGNVVKDCPATYISSVSTCGSAGFSAAEIAQVINASNGTTSGSGGSTQDTNYPQFSNYQDNNATLLDSGIGLFNVTVANTNGTVLLEINNTNVTANSLGNGIYSASYSVSNGTYSYRWYSYGDGASHNLGVSSSRNYVVYKAGKALGFNGNSQYVITNANNILDNNHVGAVIVWIKTGDINVNSVIFGYGNQINSVRGNYDLSIISGKLAIQYQATSSGCWDQFVASTLVNDSTWKHVVFTADGVNKVKIYINGVEEVVTYSTLSCGAGVNSDWFADAYGVTADNSHITIGAIKRVIASSENMFNGSIDDVLIFNRSLSSAEVSRLYNNGVGLRADMSIVPFNSGLVAGYRFDEGIGVTAYDILGVNNGTLINGPTYITGKVSI